MMIGVIASAATGSAHYQPNAAFNTNPSGFAPSAQRSTERFKLPFAVAQSLDT